MFFSEYSQQVQSLQDSGPHKIGFTSIPPLLPKTRLRPPNTKFPLAFP
jgi:hypothetical protein